MIKHTTNSQKQFKSCQVHVKKLTSIGQNSVKLLIFILFLRVPQPRLLMDSMNDVDVRCAFEYHHVR